MSRAYFGPNQHVAGAAAYLLVAIGAGDAERLADPRVELRRRLNAALSAIGATEASIAPPDAQQQEPWSSVLAVQTALRQVVGATGEPIASIEHLAASGDDRIELVIPCADAEVVRRAGVLAVELVDALLQVAPDPFGKARDWRTELVELQAFAASRRSSLTEAGILAAAAERDIPVIRFDRWPLVPEENNPTPVQRGLLQLGQGVHGKRLVGTATGAVLLRSDPQRRDRVHPYRALWRAGVTLPERDPEFSHINSARRAVRSAQRLGYPVVLKPCTGPSGAGVAVNLANDEAVAAAYQAASPCDRHVVVERHIEGEVYRLLIIGGEVVGASQRPSPQGVGHASAVDPAVLAVELKTMALRAAGCFGLDVAEVDLITPDPRLPLATAGGAVIGVDSAPDLGLYRAGGEAIPLSAARRFLAHLFPEGAPTRIPIAAITGTAGKTTTSRMVARMLQEAGYSVGLACSDGVYVGGGLVNPGVFSGISGALQVLAHARVEVAVLEVSRGTLVQRGLGFDRANVGACTKVEEDHLRLEGIQTVAAMARLKRVVIEQATELAVLNAEDPNCLAMCPHTRARRTCMVSTDPTRGEVLAHAAAGGCALVLEGPPEAPLIRLWEGNRRETLIGAHEMPAAWGGAARHNIQNALFAAAIALGMGVELGPIRGTLSSFSSSLSDSPGRINRYDKLPFRVIIDRGGTTPGYRALSDFVDRIPVQGHRLLVFHGMGDRRDEDLWAIARRVARSFDQFICFDTDPRGRQPGEVPELLRCALQREGVAPDQIAVCLDRKDAILQAVTLAVSGDLVVIASGRLQQVIVWLDEHVASLSNGRAH